MVWRKQDGGWRPFAKTVYFSRHQSLVVVSCAIGDKTIPGETHPSAKHKIAKTLVRYPWIVSVMRGIYRWGQPRFTAGVIGVVENKQGRILLVEHVYHPDVPWGLPGGWLRRRESPEGGLARELREETGIEVSVKRPLVVSAGYLHQHIDTAFLCDALSDVKVLSPEILNYRWVEVSDVPTLLPFHLAAIEELKKVRALSC